MYVENYECTLGIVKLTSDMFLDSLLVLKIAVYSWVLAKGEIPRGLKMSLILSADN